MSEKVEEILTDSVAEPKKRRYRKSKSISEKSVAVATMSMMDTESVDIKKETASETNEVSVEAEVVQVSEDTSVEETNDPIEEAVPHTYITGECIEAPLGFRLYTSSVSRTARGRIRGKFYVWDPTVCEGRIRLTDSPSGVARIDRCIGWTNVCELELFVK